MRVSILGIAISTMIAFSSFLAQCEASKTIKSGIIDIGDARLFYEECGSGAPLIFVHAHTVDRRMWEPQFSAFADKYRVIRYDLRGYGKSSMPVEGQYFQHAADLVKLMDKLGVEKAHLVGLSLGAWVVTDMAALFPERVLSISAAAGGLHDPTNWQTETAGARDSRIVGQRLEKSQSIAKAKEQRGETYRAGCLDAYAKAACPQNWPNAEPALKTMLTDWTMWQPLHMEPPLDVYPSVTRRLAENPPNFPVQVIIGKYDWSGSIRASELLIEINPATTAVYLDNAGHFSNLENPKAFNDALKTFLDQTSPADLTPVYNLIGEWIDKQYYPGVSLMIVKGDKVICERYFGSYTRETTVHIASAGKWLVAAAIAAVVDSGKLSWDDPVRKWLPEFTGDAGKATLRQLLSHTSGFMNYQPQGNHVDNYQTLAESVSHIVQLPLSYEPGTRFDYGGLAMQVAGRMAETATGQDWESLFQEKICRPLNMTNTHFTPVSQEPGHSPMLGGSAYTTLNDYMRFLDMIAGNGVYHGKRILSEAAIMAMQANQIRGATVADGEFVKKARNLDHKSIYGLGEWREILDENGNAIMISSQGWPGRIRGLTKNAAYTVFS